MLYKRTAPRYDENEMRYMRRKVAHAHDRPLCSREEAHIAFNHFNETLQYLHCTITSVSFVTAATLGMFLASHL